MENNEDKLAHILEVVANDLDADILVYNAPIDEPFDRQVVALCHKRRRRKNVLLFLVTRGGDADSAYRIAKCLQTKYERFSLYVTGYCKSAGTLVALGAHELVFGNHGELGPLDVQMSKADSLLEVQSGLTVNAALTALQDKAYLAFETFFLETEDRSQGAITVKTAAEMATNLTIGLFAPLYSQVDPLHVGEAARAMQIADQYGRLLITGSKNCDDDGLEQLITNYPSHSFVIDHQQADCIFEHVREATEAEVSLAAALGPLAITPLPPRGPFMVRYLSKELGIESGAGPAPPSSEVDELTLKAPVILPIEDTDAQETDNGTTAHRASAKPRA